ncbi:MAG: hypothetical protein HYT16_00795 [DPANN group archaeon]|nr:hypothetical protein [DPANN group archaeon]
MEKKKSKPKKKAEKSKASRPVHGKAVNIKAIDVLRKVGWGMDELSEKIIQNLERQKSVSEDAIARRLKMRVNDVRKPLYALAEKRIVTYEKKRDPKKKWWYLYFWSLDRERISGLVRETKMRELEKLRKQLEEERKYEFECRQCQKKYLHEEALESDYLCSECGSTLETARTTVTIKKLDADIKKLEKELELTSN